MPRFDRTGPEGKGSLTGRGNGNCENADSKRGFGIFRFRRKNLGNTPRGSFLNNSR